MWEGDGCSGQWSHRDKLGNREESEAVSGALPAWGLESDNQLLGRPAKTKFSAPKWGSWEQSGLLGAVVEEGSLGARGSVSILPIPLLYAPG